MGALGGADAAKRANEAAIASMHNAAKARGMKDIVAKETLGTIMDQVTTKDSFARFQRYQQWAKQKGEGKATLAESGRSTTGSGAENVLRQFDVVAESDDTNLIKNTSQVQEKLKWDFTVSSWQEDFNLENAIANARASMRDETLAFIGGAMSDVGTAASITSLFV